MRRRQLAHSQHSCLTSKRYTSKPNPLAHFRASTILRKHSLPKPLMPFTKSPAPTLPLSTAFCNTYIASLHACSSAQSVQSCCATSVGATSTSSIGGCGLEEESAIAASQDWRECLRMCSLEDKVAERDSSWWSSEWRFWWAMRRAWCWACKGARAEMFWETFCCASWVREAERAWRRCSFSGFGGMGGAGAGGLGVGRATSKGSERRSGGGAFGCGGC